MAACCFRVRPESVNSYNILTSDFATLSARANARSRAVRQLALDIKERLAVWLVQTGGARHAMKVPAARADAFAAAPPDDIRGLLIYGPDLGLVRERAKQQPKPSPEASPIHSTMLNSHQRRCVKSRPD